MLIEIEKIIVQDRIRKDFGNIQELADDIKENGLINPPVVTPEFELIAGERRLRAMKLLGYNQIEVRVMTVQDALHQLKLEISENENRKDFSFSEKMRWAEELKKEYSKIAEQNSLSNLPNGKSLPLGETGRVRDKIAQDLDIGSGEQFRKSEYIYKNANEDMIKQLDDGQLSVNAAYKKLKSDKEMAERKIKSLESRIAEVSSQKIKREVVTQEVDRPETLKTIADLREKLKKESEDRGKIYDEFMKNQTKLNQVLGESTNWKLVSSCSITTKKMLDFIKDMAEYGYMAEVFNEIPLATRQEYLRCVKAVHNWSNSIISEIEKQTNIINVEGEFINE